MTKWIAALLVAMLFGCAKSYEPDQGSQTHFLSSCEDSCAAPYACVCGVCTLPCDEETVCTDHARNATCVSASDRCDSADVCDVECDRDGECAALGADFECSDGRCRQPQIVPVPMDGPVDSSVPSDEDPSTVGESAVGEASLSTPIEDASFHDTPFEEQPGEIGALKLALLWTGLGDDGSGTEQSPLCTDPEGSSNFEYSTQVAQPIDVEVSLPVTVDISTLDAPPDAALRDNGHGGGWTAGHVVLYRDGNGNGLLDPRDLEHESPDEVLGTSGDWGLELDLTPDFSSYIIYYSEQRLPEYGPVIEAGFNVYRDDANATGTDGVRTPVPVDTAIPVPVRDITKVKILNCLEICWGGDDAFECPPSIADLPAEGHVTCYGTRSLWGRTRCEDCFCFTATCEYPGACSAL